MHKLLLVHGHLRNNMKIRMWNVLLTTIRKARNHCQDDHCEYHLGIDHSQTGNYCQEREQCQNGNEHADIQDQWSALKSN